MRYQVYYSRDLRMRAAICDRKPEVHRPITFYKDVTLPSGEIYRNSIDFTVQYVREYPDVPGFPNGRMKVTHSQFYLKVKPIPDEPV